MFGILRVKASEFEVLEFSVLVERWLGFGGVGFEFRVRGLTV